MPAQQTKNIRIPRLSSRPIKYRVGEVRHTLKDEETVQITSVTTVNVSPRRTGELIETPTGEKYLISSYKKISPPMPVTGVLFKDDKGALHWETHDLLVAYERARVADPQGPKNEIETSWLNEFRYAKEQRDEAGQIIAAGLRAPQLGGLHAIAAHWSLTTQPATIVMPTGTGKTETMLATLVSERPGSILIVVPSVALRDQTAKKFERLGLLRELGNLPQSSRNPVIGIITGVPKAVEAIEMVKQCNVVISTMSALADLHNDPDFAKRFIENFSVLIVDEAHHVAAATWLAFREMFEGMKILQFTATPYRRDGKLVDGKVIYEYPLATAQIDGYFKKISFEPVYEIDDDAADQAIATAAVEKLKKDRETGFDHLMMVRCDNKDHAESVYDLYTRLAPELSPVLVHSGKSDSRQSLEKLRSRESLIVVCVNMLGEGFDLPQLKVAAIHDLHKSLAIILQFTGRFTRSAGSNIGDATVIANIADPDVSVALERLYGEDADWNSLLSEFSSDASKKHRELIDFLNSSQRLDDNQDEETIEISHHLLNPPLSTLFFRAESFNPMNFHQEIPAYVEVHRVWLHKESSTLYFVTRRLPLIQWTRAQDLRDRQWDLFVLHYDAKEKILFLASSDKDSSHDGLAKAVGATELISGDVIFRSLANINRLVFQNMGVSKHGRRNLRYAMYTGADVARALSMAERAGSVKSNLSGTGWEDGRLVGIGCSYKGRVWTPDKGSIPELIQWSEHVGRKLNDSTIDTSKIIENVLVPEEIVTLPEGIPLSLEWPIELLRQSEERIVFVKDGEEFPLSITDLRVTSYDHATSQFTFEIFSDPEYPLAELTMKVEEALGFQVTANPSAAVLIRIGRNERPLETHLSDFPPLLRFVDLSELDGNLLIKPQNPQELTFPAERFEVWDWDSVDIRVESIWKNGAERKKSIQARTAKHFLDGGFDIVFDDDDAGEAADLVCIKIEDDSIRLALVHCKFTKAETSGRRISDVVEVASQAVRSGKWKWRFRDLCRHLINRENKTLNGRPTRFMKGNLRDINKLIKLSRFREIKAEIVIVQPGLSEENITPDQAMVLAAAYSFLQETIGVEIDVICSK